MFLLLTPIPAAAQCNPSYDPECLGGGDDLGPDVGFNPNGGTYTVASGATQTVPVTITFSDADGLVRESMNIRLWSGDSSVPLTGFVWTANTPGTFATAKGNVHLTTAGSHILTAEIQDRFSKQGSGRATFTLALIDPARPVVSTVPHHNDYRNTALGAAVLGYALPSYVSMDSDRSAALYYNSQQADPTGLVQLDVDTVAAGTAVQAVTLQIVDAATNTAVTSEDVWSRDPSGKQRVGAQWSMRDRPTGAYTFHADVRAYRDPNTPPSLTRVTVRVLVLNEISSRYGAGWTLGGVQRIHGSSAGLLVNEGNGIVRWFEKVSCTTDVSCTFRTPAGDFSRIDYDHASLSYIRTYPDGAKVMFSAAGVMTSAADRFGRATRLEWVQVDQPAVWILTKITDPAGHVTWTEWLDGYLKAFIDPAGRRADFSYGSATQGINLTRITGPSTLDVQYDARNRPVSYTGLRGTWDVAYDDRGTVRQLTAPAVIAGGVSVRPVTTFQSLQALTVLGSWVTHICCNSAAPIPADAVLTSTTDPMGHTARAALDRYGQPSKVLALSGQVTTITSNEHGLPLIISDGSRVVSQSWNDRGQLLSKEVDGAVVYHASYGAGDRLEFESTGGSTRWYSYGLRGEIVRAWFGGRDDSYRNGTSFEYDTNVRPVVAIGPKGERTEWSYAGNPWLNTSEVRTVREDGTRLVTTATYDTAGRTHKVTNPLGQVTTTSYDTLNRPVKTVDPLQRPTTYTYTGADVTAINDAAGKTYRFTYNTLGWLTSETTGGKTRTYTYNADGQTISSTDRRGSSATITVQYDASHRITQRTADGATTTFAYPDLNTVVMTNAEAVETHRLHPEIGRLYRMSMTVGGAASSHSYEVERIFDRASGWSQTGTDVRRYQNGSLLRTDTLRFTPDYRPVDTTLGFALAVQDLSGRTTTLGFDAAGQHARTVFPNGVTQSNSFTTDGRLTATSFSLSNANLAHGASYTYDLLGRRANRSAPDGNTVWSYGYDAAGQLTAYQRAELGSSTNCNPSYETCDPIWTTTRFDSYTYDSAGNRTDSGAAIEAGSNRYSAFNGYTLQYDAEGNLVRKLKPGYDQQLAWNSLGQLTSVVTNGVTVTYGYSPSGKRIRRTQGSQSLFSIYDDDDVILEVDAAGNPLRGYTHLPGIDRPLSVRITSGGQESVYYYSLEEPGQVNGLQNTVGGVAARHLYEPYGTAETSSDTTGQPLRYMARELDSTTSLYYVRARWYDPTLARFVSEDPIGLAGGINTYAYAGNDPVNQRDPSGLCPPCDKTQIEVKTFFNPIQLETIHAVVHGNGRITIYNFDNNAVMRSFGRLGYNSPSLRAYHGSRVYNPGYSPSEVREAAAAQALEDCFAEANPNSTWGQDFAHELKWNLFFPAAGAAIGGVVGFFGGGGVGVVPGAIAGARIGGTVGAVLLPVSAAVEATGDRAGNRNKRCGRHF